MQFIGQKQKGQRIRLFLEFRTLEDVATTDLSAVDSVTAEINKMAFIDPPTLYNEARRETKSGEVSFEQKPEEPELGDGYLITFPVSTIESLSNGRYMISVLVNYNSGHVAKASVYVSIVDAI